MFGAVPERSVNVVVPREKPEQVFHTIRTFTFAATCTVRETNAGGVEVEIAGGALGFIRKAELARDRDEQRPERFAKGEKMDAKVTNVDAVNRRLVLSVKALEIDDEKQAMAEFGSSDSGASLGDILGAALRQKQQEEQTKGD